MKKGTTKVPRRAECKIEKKICRQDGGNGPAYCPTINLSKVVDDACTEYESVAVKAFAKAATIQEGECYVNRGKDNPSVRYAIKPRVQETIEFAHKMGYHRLGLAFCGGLKNEAKILTVIFKSQGFEVVSVVCKAGRIPKEFLSIDEAQKCNPGSFEPMCNPISQAKILNATNTEFNIIFGLCVGHDSLVLRYSDAFCTVLVAKDRVTGHNPLAAINLHHSYYKKLRDEKFDKGGAVSVTVKRNQ